MARAATAAARPAPARSRAAGQAAAAGSRAARPAGRTAAQARRRPARKLRRGRATGLAGLIPRPALAAGAATLPALRRSPLARGARAGGTRVLDALVAGHGWIALIFVLLAGLVFFNVDLLQLNREIATGTDKAADLRRMNASLRVELAKLGSSERIQREAAATGFVLPAPGDVVYLRATRKDADRALKLITAPDPVPLIPPVEPEPVVEAPAVEDPAAPVADPTDPTAETTDEAAVDPTTGAVRPTDPATAGATGAPEAPAG